MTYLFKLLHRLDYSLDVNVDNASIVDKSEDFLKIANTREGGFSRDGVCHWLLRSRKQQGKAQLILKKLSVWVIRG